MIIGIIASQSTGYTWVGIGHNDTFVFEGTTYYYHAAGIGGSVNPKPRLAILDGGLDYVMHSAGSIWVYAGEPFPYTGSVLPTSGIEIGGVFFRTDGNFFKRIS